MELRNRVRIFFLWLWKEFMVTINMCEYCGKRGAAPCSVAGLKKLCDKCGAEACQGYSVIADECTEELPCFDTYPYAVPRYLTEKHSTSTDLENNA